MSALFFPTGGSQSSCALGGKYDLRLNDLSLKIAADKRLSIKIDMPMLEFRLEIILKPHWLHFHLKDTFRLE